MEIKFKKIANKMVSRNRGLTLVELLVVISIFLVISGVTIFEYGNFRSNVSLQNLTDDIALAIRKAQSFAIGARAVKVSGTPDFDNSFGVHFSINSLGTVMNGSNKSFLMFSVPPSASSKKYEYSGSADCGDISNDCIELFKINTADYIKEIIVDNSNKTSTTDPEGSLDIVFTRPDPRAYFCYRTTLGSSCQNASSVGIKISNGQLGEKEKTRIISIQNTGQISTQ